MQRLEHHKYMSRYVTIFFSQSTKKKTSSLFFSAHSSFLIYLSHLKVIYIYIFLGTTEWQCWPSDGLSIAELDRPRGLCT